MKNALRDGLFACGLNVTGQTETAAVLGLIRRLQPGDSGKELIRLGGAGDGGYLIPDDLAGIEYCFSPGVSNTSSFEEDLADRNIRSFLADYSVEAPPHFRPEFTFDKKFLGASNQGPFITLETWKEKHLGDYAGDLILQMDIEGWEYQVILSTPDDLLDQFRIAIIEVHHLHKLFDKFAFTQIEAFFSKLLQHFQVVHLHPNNCSGSVRRDGIEVPRVLEMTFVNRKRVMASKLVTQFPNRLDKDNVERIASLPLPRCWYAGA